MMETLIKIFAPATLLFDELSMLDYLNGNVNMAIRLILLLVCLPLLGSLVFYLLGRFFNLRYNWQWFLAFALLGFIYTLIMYNWIFEHIWFGDSQSATDFDWAFIFSPLLWLFLFYIAFSKLWLSIKSFTIFSKFTPSFLLNK